MSNMERLCEEKVREAEEAAASQAAMAQEMLQAQMQELQTELEAAKQAAPPAPTSARASGSGADAKRVVELQDQVAKLEKQVHLRVVVCVCAHVCVESGSECGVPRLAGRRGESTPPRRRPRGRRRRRRHAPSGGTDLENGAPVIAM